MFEECLRKVLQGMAPGDVIESMVPSVGRSFRGDVKVITPSRVGKVAPDVLDRTADIFRPKTLSRLSERRLLELFGARQAYQSFKGRRTHDRSKASLYKAKALSTRGDHEGAQKHASKASTLAKKARGHQQMANAHHYNRESKRVFGQRKATPWKEAIEELFGITRQDKSAPPPTLKPRPGFHQKKKQKIINKMR